MSATPSITIDELYATQIRPRPPAERLRLLALLAQDAAALAQQEADEPEKMTIDEHLARANYTGGRKAVKDVALVQPEADEPEKMTITERLARANYTGGSLFKTAEEVDAYIREERDSWER